MDTSIITPRAVAARMPAIASSVTDRLPDVPSIDGFDADRLPIPDVDVDAAVRRSRRLAARVIPWMSPPRRRVAVHWWVVGAAIVVAAGVVVWRRRTTERTTEPDSPASTTRDDWRTGAARAADISSAVDVPETVAVG